MNEQNMKAKMMAKQAAAGMLKRLKNVNMEDVESITIKLVMNGTKMSKDEMSGHEMEDDEMEEEDEMESESE
jgi:predicted DNA-binding antitoxin AbrB/MazE fold protein